METLDLLNAFFATIDQRPQIGTSHIGLYAALYYLYLLNACQDPVLIKRREVMDPAKILASLPFIDL
jgi:hypothetical protein